MAASGPFWRTEISQVRPGEIRVRGYDLVDLVGRRPYGDVVYLLLSGDLPRGNEGRMIDATLVAADLGFRGRWCALAKTFEDVSEGVFGRRLRMNIDGALAAILLELGLDWRLGKAFYVIARAPGFVAHAFEEMTRERPYRDIGWGSVAYEGPEPRSDEA